MGRRFICWSGACIAIALGFEPVQAREPAPPPERAVASAIVSRQAARPVSLQYDAIASSAVTPVRPRSFIEDPLAGNDGPSATSARRKAITLFRFNTQMGEVAVQAVFGTAKGAQLSLGF